MKPFLDENFLLESDTARRLFHDFAKKMPIFDYHSHLPPADISENRKFRNLTEIWLEGDHYKWRAMRANGIAEELITGKAGDLEKFKAWASTVPYTIGNPLYHWTHLELQRYFGIKTLLNSSTAEAIFRATEEALNDDNFRVHSLLSRMNVNVVCTTDDPLDSLEHHKAAADQKDLHTRVLPTFRPDKAMAFGNQKAFNSYLSKLAELTDIDIKTWDTFLGALGSRHEYFHSAGCRLSDHALILPVYVNADKQKKESLFSKIRSGKDLEVLEIQIMQTAFLQEAARLNSRKGWTMQIHMGALRNNNSRMFAALGPDTGFDTIADGEVAAPLAKFLDSLEITGELPKTIIYTLNPRDNYLLASMIGNFQGGDTPGKMQFGSGWWFNDQKEGMEMQMNALTNLGLLSRFVGMLTDSRSFLSYPRHEYFRRILCNLIGNWVEKGEAPNDMNLLGRMVEDISYNNAKDYFGVEI